MVAKSKKASSGRKKKIKVLNLKRETIKDLSGAQAKKVKGGVGAVGTKSLIFSSQGNSVSSGVGHTYVGISGGKSTINFGPSA